MNIKNFLLPLSLALLTTWAIQYFILNRFSTAPLPVEVQSGQSFLAPQSVQEALPLKKDIVLDEATKKADIQLTTVNTDLAEYVFSTAGGCLDQVTVKRPNNPTAPLMAIMAECPEKGNKEQAFFVALADATPYSYTLINKDVQNDATRLTYRAENSLATIEKQFVVHHATFQIDLLLSIVPKEGIVQARIIFPAPYTKDIADDTISVLVNNPKGTLVKEARAKVDTHKGWFIPSLFGTENRYFVTAMIADPAHFTQRAYIDITPKGVTSYLESGTIQSPSHWNLSFYCGPKEEKALRAVDARLEQAVEYSGWLAPLSRFLLMILNYLYQFLHNYGWAIIVMTLLINLLLLPLNIKSMQGMKKNAEVQKKLAYLQHKYKDNPDQLAREKTELMSKNGMALISGCLPKLAQLPIFFALSRVLSNAIELHKAPFLWIPDLSARDPYYILPVAIGAAMLMQPTTGVDPQQRFTMMAVALIFAAFSVNLSAGLCLYILVGVLLTIAQMFLQKKINW